MPSAKNMVYIVKLPVQNFLGLSQKEGLDSAFRRVLLDLQSTLGSWGYTLENEHYTGCLIGIPIVGCN